MYDNSFDLPLANTLYHIHVLPGALILGEVLHHEAAAIPGKMRSWCSRSSREPMPRQCRAAQDVADYIETQLSKSPLPVCTPLFPILAVLGLKDDRGLEDLDGVPGASGDRARSYDHFPIDLCLAFPPFSEDSWTKSAFFKEDGRLDAGVILEKSGFSPKNPKNDMQKGRLSKKRSSDRSAPQPYNLHNTKEHTEVYSLYLNLNLQHNEARGKP